MASDNSFDVVSKIDMPELNNAMNQASREIETRFDFKGSKSEITLEKEEIVILSDDEFKLQNVLDILSGGIDSVLRGLGKSSIHDLTPDDILVPEGFTRTLGVPRAEAP